MNAPEAHKAILQTWINAWPGLSSNVPYAIDNRRLKNPTPPFAIVDIVNVSSDQRTMGRTGARRFERLGFIDVRLFGPPDMGRAELDTLAEYVRDIYESTRLGAVGDERGVVTYAMSTTEVRGDREWPDLFCLLCRIPFYYFEVR